jgi:predicted methyltransferase
MSQLVRRPLILSLVAALSLAACNEAPPPAPAPTPAPAPEVAAPAPAPAPVAATPAPATDAALDAALASATRTPENVARDSWRHPRETLSFFGIAPTQTVIEVTPGGGWYTEILAPYLRDAGRYIAVIVDPTKVPAGGARDYYTKSNEEFRAKLAGNAEAYGKATVTEYDPSAPVFAEPGSADLVLTFRNVHNWMGQDQAQGMFDGFYAALKPGGVLGVVEHRAAEDVPKGDRSGYVSENQVIAFATNAGFQMIEASEINANPKDTKDHPNGVWTLPPVSRTPEGEDGQKYRDIGESDRMTIKFVKPESAVAPAAPAAEAAPVPASGG